MHDFTTWLFGMIIIDIPSVLAVLPVVIEIEKETLLLIIVSYTCSSGIFIDGFYFCAANTAQYLDFW